MMVERKPEKFAALRTQAEEVLGQQPLEGSVTEARSVELLELDKLKRLIHELQVYQIELEIQNEQLQQTQQQLEMSADKYTDLYDFAPLGYLIINRHGFILEANLTVASMLLMERGRLINRDLTHLIAKENRDQYYLCRRAVFKSKSRHACEVRVVRGDGSLFDARLEGVVVEGESVLQARIAMIDISKRKRAEEALRQSEERFRTIFETATVGMALSDLQERFIEVNRAFEQMVGYSAEELYKMSFAQLTHPEDIKADLEERRSQKALLDHNQAERRYLRQDGQLFWGHVNGILIRDTLGAPQYRFAIIEDITKRKIAEEALKRRNRELETLNLFSAAVSSSLELPALLGTLKKLLAEQLDLPGGGIFFYDQKSDYLELTASWGIPPKIEAQLGRFPVNGFHNEHVIREKTIAKRRDFREIPLFLTLGLDVARPAWQSYLCVPLLAKGKIQGLMTLFSKKAHFFDENDIPFFKNLGHQVGVAVQNARLYSEVLAKREQLQQLTQQVFLAQEEERRHISRELHDDAGQLLIALKFTLQITRNNLADYPKKTEFIDEQLAEAITLCEKTSAQIRFLAHDLRPAALDDLGLHIALKGLCNEFARRTQLFIQYDGVEPPPRPDTADICLYRFLQEALTNVAKHAHATQILVRLYHQQKKIYLSIQDNGQGFSQPVEKVLSAGKGIGLLGMQERLESLDGELSIASEPGYGTRLEACVPCLGARL